MDTTERNAVKTVAKITPWLAPVPSAFFVSRAAITHLNVPFMIGVVIAGIIESLGLASVHTWLWLADWNSSRRKSDPPAPSGVALVLGIIYLATTIGLTVILEVRPSLSTYAPALFPILAVVGAVNLVLISQQEQRELAVQSERQERRMKRQKGRQSQSKNVSNNGTFDPNLDVLQRARMSKRDERINGLLTFYSANPDATVSQAGRAIGVSRQTVYNYQRELIDLGRLRENGNEGWEVV